MIKQDRKTPHKILLRKNQKGHEQKKFVCLKEDTKQWIKSLIASVYKVCIILSDRSLDQKINWTS